MSRAVPTPQLLPVLDLRGGVVVQARGGERASYQPVRSRLVAGSRPLDVAAALCDAVGHRRLYVADLDGLQRAAPDWDTLAGLVQAGFDLCVDAGLRDTATAQRLLNLGVRQVIAALETSPGPEHLAALVDVATPSRLVFSLDLQSGRPLLASKRWAGGQVIDIARSAVTAGIETLLVLDLAGVGGAGGLPTLDLCRQIRAQLPSLRLWTGGGVRDVRDVAAAGDCGVAAVLVASALHQRHLGPVAMSSSVRGPELLVCELTPPGRGAVATLRLSGALHRLDASPPLFRAANGRPLAGQPLQQIAFGSWGLEAPEEVVVCRVEPHAAEVHCHGGRAAVARIMADVVARGGALETPRAWLDRTSTPLESECAWALTQTRTERTASLLAEQGSGILLAALQRIVGGLTQLFESARAVALTQSRATDVPPDVPRELASLQRWSEFGRHLVEPWQVVLCGRPNVGKSSLVNALAGFRRSLVSPQPGTTRDVVTTALVLEGWPLELADTAGLRATGHAIEAEGVLRAEARLMTADLVLLLLDASQPLTAEDCSLLDRLPQAVVIAHKCDLPRAWTSAAGRTAVPVSAATGEGVTGLQSEIVRRLVPVMPPPGTAVPVTGRLAADLDRAQHLLQQGQAAAALELLHPWIQPPQTRV